MRTEPVLSERDFPLLHAEDADYVYRLCEATVRQPVVALWGHWPEDQLRSEIVRAVAGGEYQAVMQGEARVGVVSVPWDETCCEIAQLFIEPEHQLRGAGRSTVDSVVRQALRARKP